MWLKRHKNVHLHYTPAHASWLNKGGEQKRAIAVSRGSHSTKIHAIADSKGRPLNLTVGGGLVYDTTSCDKLALGGRCAQNSSP